ncbi:MAG TPA: polyribonucleotide nucleotidyltransferase [Candidatus Paceibacterota bacterium]|jgi:polyribonucleotide nucleotidyltransferase|nr:polyribonucleotide nucleotidyltransferase [Candidatus Paceibacterota bacterium]
MKDKKEFSIDVAGKTLTIEVSSLAEQANAAVLAKYGETVVLATAVMSHKEVPMDYMPLKVDYEEKFYAAGKIIGSRFIRREGRASEEAILAGRLVDRTIRPLFDSRTRHEIQVVVTVLQIDEENDPEFVGLLGVSTALLISDIPWNGPVAGVRVVQVGNEFKMNPDNFYVTANPPVFDAFVSGSKDRINMLELGGLDAQEKDIAQGFTLAQKEINRLVEFQEKIRAAIGKPKAEVKIAEPGEEVKAAVNAYLADKLEGAVFRPSKMEQKSAVGELKTALFAHLKETFAEKEPNYHKAADFLFEEAVNDIVHEKALKAEKRPDGRKLDELRALSGEVKMFSRTHGSAIFVRGNTQALAVTTLAAPGAEQMIETMETTTKRRFMLHYNFPPFSVGEVGMFRGPGRREIGHGNLARKSLERLIPSKEEFPYTIRVVSEIMSSNGSSSMATVCASALSLMDAGVPLKKPAAGIAMGLMMKDVKNYKVLTDIQGPEDHHGDMDCKVAGTTDGVTGMQMDIKVDGLTVEILEKTLAQARKARLEILDAMKKVLPAARETLSPFVPTIRILKIPTEKIGAVIGPGGKIINGLIEKYALAGIDIDEDGGVFVSGMDLAKVEAAVGEIRGITREFKVGEIVEGNIIKVIEVGAIVDLGGGKDGMVHVSELKQGFVKKVEDVVKVGDFVRAKIIRVGDDGRIGLSMKQLQA